MPKYERDDDQIERVLKDAHEAVGQLRTLVDDLSRHITDLKTELNPDYRYRKGV